MRLVTAALLLFVVLGGVPAAEARTSPPENRMAELYDDGNYDAAEQVFRNAPKQALSANAWEIAGDIARARKDAKAALERYQRANALEPTDLRADYVRRMRAQIDAEDKALHPTVARLCGDLGALETAAAKGALSADARTCVEGAIGSVPQLTERDRGSRILLVDAQHRGDRADLARLLERHLGDISRADPRLELAYALVRYRIGRDPGTPADQRGAAFALAHTWADRALERILGGDWDGEIREAALRLRALAAERLWEDAERRVVNTWPHDDEERYAWSCRTRLAADVSEWLEWARAAGKDTDLPSALCASAFGTRARCAP